MSKTGTTKTGMTEKPDPWRVPVVVAQIPETGLHRDIEADQAIRNAVADVGGLREVLSVQASFDVTPTSGGRFHVAGHVRARVGQNCVVTLEEIETDIDEPIENGMIDLGRVATDAVYLALDPYPRKPGAVFEPVVEAADPEDHPFAALKALKAEPKKSGTRKPKGK